MLVFVLHKNITKDKYRAQIPVLIPLLMRPDAKGVKVGEVSVYGQKYGGQAQKPVNVLRADDP
jgi:hypothetical protein